MLTTFKAPVQIKGNKFETHLKYVCYKFADREKHEFLILLFI